MSKGEGAEGKDRSQRARAVVLGAQGGIRGRCEGEV